MRLRPLFTAALILWVCAPALAQEWKEFAFQQDRFTCNFPGDPKITDTTFMSQFGHRLPARVYSVELSPTHKYSVTVVDYTKAAVVVGAPVGQEAAEGTNCDVPKAVPFGGQPLSARVQSLSTR